MFNWKDMIPGGLADDKDPSRFDEKQLKAGIKVELEHTDDVNLATEIAMDHLTEDPEYYVKLAKIENEALDHQDYHNIDNVADHFKKELLSRGIDTEGMAPIGSGMSASVERLRDGRVLKITQDLSDAQASMKVKGRKTDHIVNVEDVFQFPGTDLFGIVTNKLIQLNSSEKAQLNNVIKKSMITNILYTSSAKGWNGIINELDRIKKHLEIINSPEEFEHIINDINVGIKGVKKFQIPEMLDELEKFGIWIHDLHQNNIMKDEKNNYVLVDLGDSKTKDVKKLPILNKEEGYMKEEKATKRFQTKLNSKLAHKKDAKDPDVLTAWVERKQLGEAKYDVAMTALKKAMPGYKRPESFKMSKPETPSMSQIFKKDQPKQEFPGGKQPLSQVSGKYLHVPQSSKISPYWLYQTKHTYETLPNEMLKYVTIDANKEAQWGTTTYRIESSGELTLVASNVDTSD